MEPAQANISRTLDALAGRCAQLAIVVILLTAAASVWAQQPSNEEVNARIQTLVAQRNAAQDQVVVLSGQAAVEVAKLQAEIERLKKECPAPKKDEPKK